MKNIAGNVTGPLAGVITFLLIAGCEKSSPETTRLTENEQSWKAIYEQILTDEKLLNEFIIKIQQDEEAMNLVMTLGQFLRRVYSEEFSRELVRQHPDIREVMIRNMIAMMQQDTFTYNEMNQMMEEFHEKMGEMR
ncbi:MAG: hypothetical protein KFF73_05290 [Cyclobacteriaceae bacterium]|nr:hypothetical protein [Cyclobacteriaceae bacterium]